MTAIVSAASAERLEETFDQVLAFSQGDLLELGNTNGQIQIETWDRDEIRIEAVKKARGDSHEKAAVPPSQSSRS